LSGVCPDRYPELFGLEEQIQGIVEAYYGNERKICDAFIEGLRTQPPKLPQGEHALPK
jgi:hypothetical protein